MEDIFKKDLIENNVALDFSEFKMIGQGGFGSVYQISDDKVVKIIIEKYRTFFNYFFIMIKRLF
jgi:hypothetical protein